MCYYRQKKSTNNDTKEKLTVDGRKTKQRKKKIFSLTGRFFVQQTFIIYRLEMMSNLAKQSIQICRYTFANIFVAYA